MRSAFERDSAFTEFVLTRRPALVRLAGLVLSGDRCRAEDVVQTALTRLYLAWPRISQGTVDAYARRCVVNAALDDRRRLFRWRENSSASVPDVPVVDPDRLEQAMVLDLLKELAPRMRATVVLRYGEGLSIAETAAALGCGEGTVKSQSAKALNRLRALYTERALHCV